jgi:transcription antitermination factor NusB
MRKRTLAREFAVQILYQIDITGRDCEETLGDFWQVRASEEIGEDIREFTSGLVRGVRENLVSIDERIARYAANWELKRMAVVDRNILRLTSYELIFREDIPPKVSINEGVELAKKFSDVNAGKFVNGILDKIKLERSK